MPIDDGGVQGEWDESDRKGILEGNKTEGEVRDTSISNIYRQTKNVM